MRILAIDTALKTCAVAIVSRDAAPVRRVLPMEKGHAEHLAPLVAEAFAEAGLVPRDIDRIGVVVGPGGFAGVRVGLAFARGLALATGAPAWGVDTMTALVASYRGTPDAGGRSQIVGAVVDARRGQVYAALHRIGAGPNVTLCSPFVASPDDAGQRLRAAAEGDPAVLIGDGAGLLPDGPHQVAAGYDAIDPVAVARLIADAPPSGAPPSPIYLRPPDAREARPSAFEALLVP